MRYRFQAALDSNGNLIGYKCRGVGINAGNTNREDNFPSGGVDNLLIETIEHKSPITSGAWRAPITIFLGFAKQSFLDEVAEAAGKDPVQLRLNLLAKARTAPAGVIKYSIDRMEAIIKLAAEKAGWGKAIRVPRIQCLLFAFVLRGAGLQCNCGSRQTGCKKDLCSIRLWSGD